MVPIWTEIPRLHTALAEWLACLVYLFPMVRQMGKKIPVSLSAGALVVQMVFLQLTDHVPLWLWMPCMAVAVGLMYLFLCLASGQFGWATIYHCARAFVLAEFAAALEWQAYQSLVLVAGFEGYLWQWVTMTVVYVVVYGCAFWLERLEKSNQPVHLRFGARDAVGAATIALAVFFMSNLNYALLSRPSSSPLAGDILQTRTLVDLGGLAVLYAYHIQRRELQLRYELHSIQNVLQNQYHQYQQSKETIALIEHKYHDLKHQIAALRTESDASRREAWLDEMEQEIKAYEAQNKTGNPVLDTVLTGKMLYCQKQNIQLTCVADGSLLEFLDVRDICTIFGNALDNAIECELGVENKSQRLIHVNVSVKKRFVVLRFENYCPQAPVFEQGVPLSTKQDARYHGFGFKSIQFTAQKYGGTATAVHQDSWFIVKVLLPIPASLACKLAKQPSNKE